MKTVCFISPYQKTNNYLVEILPQKFIGIDIGSIGKEPIKSFLKVNDGSLMAYFITHAHADHCMGIKDIYDEFQIPIFCSSICALDMGNSRKNFSIYSNEIPTFEYELPFEILDDNEIVNLNGIEISAFSVPGHTKGCMAFKVGNSLFSGDFLMLNHKTPLNFPDSNKEVYNQSVLKMSQLDKQIEVYYSGHGVTFSSMSELAHLTEILNKVI